MVKERNLVMALKHPRKGKYDLYNPITGRILERDGPAMQKLIEHINEVSEAAFVAEIRNRSPKIPIHVIEMVAAKWIALAIRRSGRALRAKAKKAHIAASPKKKTAAKKRSSSASPAKKKATSPKKRSRSELEKELKSCEKRVKKLASKKAAPAAKKKKATKPAAKKARVVVEDSEPETSGSEVDVRKPGDAGREFGRALARINVKEPDPLEGLSNAEFKRRAQSVAASRKSKQVASSPSPSSSPASSCVSE